MRLAVRGAVSNEHGAKNKRQSDVVEEHASDRALRHEDRRGRTRRAAEQEERAERRAWLVAQRTFDALLNEDPRDAAAV